MEVVILSASSDLQIELDGALEELGVRAVGTASVEQAFRLLSESTLKICVIDMRGRAGERAQDARYLTARVPGAVLLFRAERANRLAQRMLQSGYGHAVVT